MVCDPDAALPKRLVRIRNIRLSISKISNKVPVLDPLYPTLDTPIEISAKMNKFERESLVFASWQVKVNGMDLRKDKIGTNCRIYDV